MRSLAAAIPQAGGPALLPGVLVVGTWALWAADSGGFFPSQWGSLGAFLVVVVGLAVVLLPSARPPGRAGVVVLVSLGLFVAWNYLSILWADSRGDALAGAGKTLVYAVGLAFFLVFAWTSRGRLAVVGLFVLAIAAVAAVELARLGAGASPLELFDADGRLIGPAGYTNGSAALWTIAFWPAAFLACSRSVPIGARAASAAAASAFLSLAFLGQSRGWLLAVPATAVVGVLLAPARTRFLACVALSAAPLLWLAGPLLDVGERARGGDAATLHAGRAAAYVVLSAIPVALGVAAWALVDRRVVLPRRAHRAAGAVALAAVVGAAGIGAGVALTRIDEPGAWAKARWEEFKGQSYPDPDDRSRFAGALGSHRYEQWRIAWGEFVASPVTGIGADNFLVPYLEQRSDAGKTSRYPHSIPLRLLSQLGAIGTALWLVALGTALWLALLRRRRLDEPGTVAVAAALCAFAYWALHGSVDWFWEIPALAAAAFGLLGLAAADAVPEEGTAREPGPRRVATVVAVGLGVAVSCLALVPPWLSYSYQQSGVAVWRVDRATAEQRLELASRLNPFTAEPLLLEGSIALRVRDLDAAEASYALALEREPKNAYALALLGFLAGARGEEQEARRYLERAATLNPLDPVVGRARRDLAEGRALDPVALNRLYASGAASPEATEVSGASGLDDGTGPP